MFLNQSKKPDKLSTIVVVVGFFKYGLRGNAIAIKNVCSWGREILPNLPAFEEKRKRKGRF
jgi:hypothetical protein